MASLTSSQIISNWFVKQGSEFIGSGLASAITTSPRPQYFYIVHILEMCSVFRDLDFQQLFAAIMLIWTLKSLKYLL